MKRIRHSPEQIIRKLREADRDLAKGLTVSDFCRKVGVAQTTYHRWRKRHDPKQVDSDRRCRQLEKVDIESDAACQAGLSPDQVSTALTELLLASGAVPTNRAIELARGYGNHKA